MSAASTNLILALRIIYAAARVCCRMIAVLASSPSQLLQMLFNFYIGPPKPVYKVHEDQIQISHSTFFVCHPILSKGW